MVHIGRVRWLVLWNYSHFDTVNAATYLLTEVFVSYRCMTAPCTVLGSPLYFYLDNYQQFYFVFYPHLLFSIVHCLIYIYCLYLCLRFQSLCFAMCNSTSGCNTSNTRLTCINNNLLSRVSEVEGKQEWQWGGAEEVMKRKETGGGWRSDGREGTERWGVKGFLLPHCKHWVPLIYVLRKHLYGKCPNV